MYVIGALICILIDISMVFIFVMDYMDDRECIRYGNLHTGDLIKDMILDIGVFAFFFMMAIVFLLKYGGRI